MYLKVQTLHYRHLPYSDYERLQDKSGAYALSEVHHNQSGIQVEWWYMLNDRLHRSDGPARIHANGSREWYRYGVPVAPPKNSRVPRHTKRR